MLIHDRYKLQSSSVYEHVFAKLFSNYAVEHFTQTPVVVCEFLPLTLPNLYVLFTQFHTFRLFFAKKI